MSEYSITKEDLIQLFGREQVVLRDQELLWFSCDKKDNAKFHLIMRLVSLEAWLTLTLKYKNYALALFEIDIENYIEWISREETSLEVYRPNDLPVITFSFEPNFSLNLPELSITKKPTPQMLELPMVFCQRTIGLLFECEPVVDEAGNISFSKTNSDGFTLFVTVFPSARKCFAKLTFVHYQDPVFQATFTKIVAIDCDLTREGKGLIIKGQQESEVVKILFNPTFSMELDTWIFYGQLS